MRSMENKLENAFQGLTESLPDCIAQKVEQRIRASFVVNGQMHPTLNDMDRRFSLYSKYLQHIIWQHLQRYVRNTAEKHQVKYGGNSSTGTMVK